MTSTVLRELLGGLLPLARRRADRVEDAQLAHARQDRLDDLVEAAKRLRRLHDDADAARRRASRAVRLPTRPRARSPPACAMMPSTSGWSASPTMTTSVAAAHELLGGLVRLAHVRAGGVDDVEPLVARRRDDGGVDAVRPDDERAASAPRRGSRRPRRRGRCRAATACGLWMSGPSVWTSAPLSAASSASLRARSTP